MEILWYARNSVEPPRTVSPGCGGSLREERVAVTNTTVRNLVGAEWIRPAGPTLPIYDPATAEILGEVPLSGAQAVDAAVGAAARAFPDWSRTPLLQRVALMFRFKALLEAHADELAHLITRHHGKTLEEASGEVRRGIEVVDFACGAPTLLQGRTLREVSRGVGSGPLSLSRRRRGRDPALQLPHHDPAVDAASRHRAERPQLRVRERGRTVSGR